ncbi:hypothetical protein G7Y89_g2325 [Cudoniella acicularis]|uniref:Heterokaryon incompatibility domain-containing protein n=1 Tax=Cudoniella acicularis TaxID=354080 RepID=A0A8H4W735_9HELO|nr:hypothetical protein G7Y89_g2325 [Cudoniella acicularis]
MLNGEALVATDSGDLVWHSQSPGLYANLNVQPLRFGHFLTYWNGTKATDSLQQSFGYGYVSILDTSYNEVRRICPKLNLVTVNGTQYECPLDMRESYITEQTTLIATVVNVTSADLSSIGGPVDGYIYNTILNFHVRLLREETTSIANGHNHVPAAKVTVSFLILAHSSSSRDEHSQAGRLFNQQPRVVRHNMPGNPARSECKVASLPRLSRYYLVYCSARLQVDSGGLLEFLSRTAESFAFPSVLDPAHEIMTTVVLSPDEFYRDEGAERLMVIGDGLFLVRKNLDCALKQFRYDYEPRTLWVDAIYINQSDVDERGDQVSQMGSVYSKANDVIIWLGEATNDSNQGMDFLKEILMLGSYREPSEERYSDQNMADDFRTTLDRPDSNSCILALAGILARSWWDRVWMLQEIVLAHSATVYCGSKSHTWDSFEMLSIILLQPGIQSLLVRFSNAGSLAARVLRERLNRPFNIRRIRTDQASEEGMTLSRMVKRTINYDATDPRDKVYAVLSTVTHDTTLEPNYNLTKSKVYTAAFKAILQQDGDLSILCLLTAKEFRDESLPSWVPDLSSECSMVPISAAHDERVGRVHNASPPHRKFPEGSMQFRDDDTVLVLTGVTVGTISCLGTTAPDIRLAPIRDYALRSMKEAMFSWGSLLMNEHFFKNYITGCTKMEAFWRTITLDQKVQGYHPGYSMRKVGAARRLGNPDEWIPPPNPPDELRLFAALDD